MFQNCLTLGHLHRELQGLSMKWQLCSVYFSFFKVIIGCGLKYLFWNEYTIQGGIFVTCYYTGCLLDKVDVFVTYENSSAYLSLTQLLLAMNTMYNHLWHECNTWLEQMWTRASILVRNVDFNRDDVTFSHPHVGTVTIWRRKVSLCGCCYSGFA